MNYDLIFVDPGYFFDKELAEVSAMFPSKTFVYIDGTSDLPNVVSVPFKQNEGAFLAGCLAALLTDKTELCKINPAKAVGFVGGFDMPVIRDYQAGYEHGVRYVDPDVKVIARYAGDHYDPALGKETAYSVLKRGRRCDLSRRPVRQGSEFLRQPETTTFMQSALTLIRISFSRIHRIKHDEES